MSFVENLHHLFTKLVHLIFPVMNDAQCLYGYINAIYRAM